MSFKKQLKAILMQIALLAAAHGVEKLSDHLDKNPDVPLKKVPLSVSPDKSGLFQPGKGLDTSSL